MGDSPVPSNLHTSPVPSSLHTKDHILTSRRSTDRFCVAITVGVAVAFGVSAIARPPILFSDSYGSLCKGHRPVVYWPSNVDGGPPTGTGAVCMSQCPSAKDVQRNVRVRSPKGSEVLVYPTVRVADSICLPKNFEYAKIIAKGTGYSSVHLHLARFTSVVCSLGLLVVPAVALSASFTLAVLGAAPLSRFSSRLAVVVGPVFLFLFAWLVCRLANSRENISLFFRHSLHLAAVAAVLAGLSQIQQNLARRRVEFLSQAQVACEVAVDCLWSMPALLTISIVFVLLAIGLALGGLWTAVCISFSNGNFAGCLTLLNMLFLVECILAIHRFVTVYCVCLWYFTLPDYHGRREITTLWNHQNNSIVIDFILNNISPIHHGISSALFYHLGTIGVISSISMALRLCRWFCLGMRIAVCIWSFVLNRFIPFFWLTSFPVVWLSRWIERVGRLMNGLWFHIETPALCELTIFPDNYLSTCRTANRRLVMTEGADALSSLAHCEPSVTIAVACIVACTSLFVLLTFRQYLDPSNNWFIESVGAGVLVFSISSIMAASVVSSSFHLTNYAIFYCLVVELQPNLHPTIPAAHLNPPPIVFAPDPMRTYWEATQISRKFATPGLALTSWRPAEGDDWNELLHAGLLE